LIWIGALAAIMLGVGLIYQGYLTYYKYPTLLFKAHGYYSPDSTTRFRPPWFKYIFTVIFLSPVVSISIFLLYRATVSIVSILLAIVLASLQPLVASHAAKQGSTLPANVATLNSNKESVSEEAFNPPLKWKNIDAGAVTFYAPPDLRENIPGKYQSRDILLEVDQFYNPATTLAGVYDDNREFQLSRTKIDGRNSEIVSFYDDNRVEHPPGFNYYAILFVPHMSGQSGITVWTYSRSQDARVVATKIFSTVRFAK
jgi:hypothetical protein